VSHYLYNKGETLKYERGFSLSNFLGELMTDIVKYGAIGQKVCVKTDITVDISIVMSV